MFLLWYRDKLDAISQRRFAGANSLSMENSETASVGSVDINKQDVWNFATLSCPVD
jgi:hypothetical protein